MMVTPAISLNKKDPATRDGVQRSVVGGVPYPWTDYPYKTGSYSGQERNMRPQSVISPVREDGTRAPRAWDRRWGSCYSPIRSLEWHDRVNSNAYVEYRVKAPVITLGNGIDTFLLQAGAHWARPSSPGAFPYDAEGIARTKFLNKLLNKQADWGVTLGEMSETVGGIRQVSEDILDLITDLARRTRKTKRAVVETILGIPPRKKKDRKRSSRERLDRADRLITDRWLQYQFSVVPTLADIHQSAEALSWLLFDKQVPARMKFRAGAKVSRSATVSDGYGVTPGWTGTVPVDVITECHISCYYDILPTTQTRFTQLGLTNPASVAWELVTCSWMVDYLTTTGEWISSMTRNDSSTFVEGSMTRVLRMTDSGPMTFAFHPRIVSHKGFGAPVMRLDAGRMQRTILSDVHPAIRPSFRNRMNITRMANTLAVLSKLIR